MRTELENRGFETVESIYGEQEVEEILALIEARGLRNAFGIREFLLRNPEIAEKVFTPNLLKLIASISPSCNISVKSIYFDKPPSANWIVNWHQDLTINLRAMEKVAGFKNWRVQKERVVVQPSRQILENIFTIRIHLDYCTIDNGALRVIENSHKQGAIEIKEWILDKAGIERICEVGRGGALLMKPLTLHSSRRTENQRPRRVIHIEFSKMELPNGLEWKERLPLP